MKPNRKGCPSPDSLFPKDIISFYFADVFFGIGVKGGFTFFAAKTDGHRRGGSIAVRHVLVGDRAFFVDRGFRGTGIFFDGSLLHFRIGLEFTLTFGAAQTDRNFNVAADGSIHILTTDGTFFIGFGGGSSDEKKAGEESGEKFHGWLF